MFRRMVDDIWELYQRGRNPSAIIMPTSSRDDWSALLGQTTVWDGVLPREFCGLPIIWEPGAGDVSIKCDDAKPVGKNQVIDPI